VGFAWEIVWLSRLECHVTTARLAKEGGIIFVQKCGSGAAPNRSLTFKERFRIRSIILRNGVTSKSGAIGPLRCVLTMTRIPESVTLEAAALLEPLSVAIHSTRRASIEQGDTVIVFGAGTVGLLVAAMVNHAAATTVMIADINAGRVDYALANKFATHGYVVPHSGHHEKTGDRFEEAKILASDVVERACAGETDFEGSDVTFDCTGKEICMQAGLYVSIVL